MAPIVAAVKGFRGNLWNKYKGGFTLKNAILLCVSACLLSACGMQPLPAQLETGNATPVAAEPTRTDVAKEDAAIKKLHGKIVAVDHQPLATPARLVLTLNGAGWNEAGIFYGFAGDVHAVLGKMQKKKLLPEGQDLVFILRGEGTDSEWRNVLDLQVPGDAVAGILTAPDPAALLQQSSVEFNGRMGREVVTAFCNDDMYQGPAGLMSAPGFCQKAIDG